MTFSIFFSTGSFPHFSMVESLLSSRKWRPAWPDVPQSYCLCHSLPALSSYLKGQLHSSHLTLQPSAVWFLPPIKTVLSEVRHQVQWTAFSLHSTHLSWAIWYCRPIPPFWTIPYHFQGTPLSRFFPIISSSFHFGSFTGYSFPSLAFSKKKKKDYYWNTTYIQRSI